MELALFTPGAYVWPVHRNFEAFVASLAGVSADVEQLAESPLYPAQKGTGIGVQQQPAELDSRLVRLHRALYDALLRPATFYEHEQRSFAECFWPDLHGTIVDTLFGALFYFFIRRTARAVPVAAGLSAVRAIFFNHEAAAPELWLHNSLARTAGLRAGVRLRELRLRVPGAGRSARLAFAVNSRRNRPEGGPGWFSGYVTRLSDAQCQLVVEFGLGPELAEETLPADVVGHMEADVRRSVARVFGWREEDAA